MKITVKNKLTIGLVALVWTLVGCQSEIDKCVNAIVKKDEPFKNAQEKNQLEAQARVFCLRAQAGK